MSQAEKDLFQACADGDVGKMSTVLSANPGVNLNWGNPDNVVSLDLKPMV